LTITNTDATLLDGFTEDTAIVTCVDGTETSSQSSTFTVSCDGTDAGVSAWSGAQSCNAVACETLTVVNSDTSNFNGVTFETVTVTCVDGFGSVDGGTFIATCEGTGAGQSAWTTEGLACEALECPLVAIANSDAADGVILETGNTLTVTCVNNTVASMNGAATFAVSCDADGPGAVALSGEDTCIALACSAEDLLADYPTNIALEAECGNHAEGEICLGYCLSGYAASYVEFAVTCSGDGWVFDADELCPADVMIHDGEIALSVLFQFAVLTESQLGNLTTILLTVLELPQNNEQLEVSQDAEGVVTVTIYPGAESVSDLYNKLMIAVLDVSSIWNSAPVVTDFINAEADVEQVSLLQCSDGTFQASCSSNGGGGGGGLSSGAITAIIILVVIIVGGISAYCICNYASCCKGKNSDDPTGFGGLRGEELTNIGPPVALESFSHKSTNGEQQQLGF
jgi:hypothetical protein